MNNNALPQTDPANLYSKCVEQNQDLKALVNAYKSYVDLLGQELDDFSRTIAARTPGWQSDRWEAGLEHRKRIQDLHNKVYGSNLG